MATLSEDQAAVYDRQLRVWGVEVQRRLNSTKVLIAGSSGLAAEVAKNIVLAGVGLVTVCNDTPVSKSPSGNFLVTADSDQSRSVAEASSSTLQAMNPLVKVQALAKSPEQLQEAGELQGVDILVLVHPALALQQRLNAKCRELGIKFLSGCIRGALGFLFLDLQTHSFSTESQGAGQASQAELQYVPLSEALSVPYAKLKPRTHPLYPVLQAEAEFEQEHGRVAGSADVAAVSSILAGRASAAVKTVDAQVQASLEEFVGQEEEVAPVAAVLGGVLANEVVKVAGGHRAPVRNLMFFSLLDGHGVVEDMP